MNDVYIERIIEYIFSNQSYIITDNVIGHLNKNVKITSNWLLHDSLILNSNNDENKLYNDTIELKFSNIQKYEIIDSHYSPRYGVMKKTSSIISRFSRSKEGKYFSKLIVSKI